MYEVRAGAGRAGDRGSGDRPILLPDYATEEVVERRWTEALTDRAAIR